MRQSVNPLDPSALDLAAHVADDPARVTPDRPLAAVPDLDEWQSWLDSWVVHLHGRNLSPTTILGYLNAYKRLVRWAARHDLTDPLAIRRRHLEAFMAAELTRITNRGRPVSASTCHMTHVRLGLFFGWLAEEEDVDDPTAKWTAPEVPDKRIEILDDDALRGLLATCKGRGFTERRDAAMIRILFDAGIRRAELAAMTTDDVDLRAGLILVHGKGRRDRVLAIGVKATEALDRYLRARARHGSRRLPNLWLADPDNKRGALGYDGIGQMLQRRGREAGVPGLHAHQLRHTAYHAHKAAGLHDGEAMAHFGWKSRAMLDHYASISAETRARDAVRKLSPGDRI